MHESDPRLDQIRDWLGRELRWPLARIERASADASFRRYFRAWRTDGATRIVMDAPPPHEHIGAYLQVTAVLEHCGVHVPRVDAANAAHGFILLEDLGSVPYLDRLHRRGDADALYGDALAALVRIQTLGGAAAGALPPYDRTALERELALMPEWFCRRHLGLALGPEEQALLAASFEFLCSGMLEQPLVLVHRDYHSRNLMVLPERNPGILDFQDAVRGPVGYDPVSLLKDCYIEWPRADVERWVGDYRARLAAAGGPSGQEPAEFLRWFDLAGLQRHLKVLGIFARLWYRDGKPGYLADLPRVFGYVSAAAAQFPPLYEFARWFEALRPRLAPAAARAAGGAA